MKAFEERETSRSRPSMFVDVHPHTFRHGCHRPDSLQRHSKECQKRDQKSCLRGLAVSSRPVRVLSAGDSLITVTKRATSHRLRAPMRSIFCVFFCGRYV